MAFIFFDDSQHAAAGFHLGAMVCTEEDPTPQIDAALRAHGLEPGQDEFKSRTATADPARMALREALRTILATDARIGVAVVSTLPELGPAGLHLLAQMTAHRSFPAAPHQAFFDRNMFRSIEAGLRVASTIPQLGACTLRLEEDSRVVRGIQLADLAASICGSMLKEKLGLITKRVVLGEDSGYSDEEVSLGFDLWSSIRYCFLRDEALDPDDPATMDARAGLYIAGSADARLRDAALERFGTVYMGCIH